MIAEKLYRWSVDRINGRFVSGWCFNRINKTKPVSIVAAADDTVLGRFSNDRYRDDLADLKLHPSGVCGFDFSFPSEFDPDSCSRFHLYFDSFKKPIVTVDCRDIKMLRPQLSSPVCFMHIPKTAGTSFNAFARECFSGDRFFTHIERLEQDERLQSMARARYLAGHLPYFQLKELLTASTYDFWAIIREPYAHLHSHLNYVKSVRPGSGVEMHYTYRHNETIKGLSDKLNAIDFSNPDHIEGFVARLKDYEFDFFDNLQTRYFLDQRPEKVSRNDLAQALDNVSAFRLVGLTEAYDLFRNRFCEGAGLKPQQQELKANRADHYRLFDLSDPRIRAALLPLVEFDLDLYDFVADSFWSV